VNNEVKQLYRNFLVAIEMSEPSANAIRAAISTGLIGDEGVTFLHAFFPLGKGKLVEARIDQPAIDKYVASERQRAADELIAFLATNGFGDLKASLQVEEGEGFAVISQVVERMRPDLLILGTHGRTGLLKALLGSVTEEALRRLDVDILAVPPVRLPPEIAKA
jgi:nucleotide-binding universal stress UspA family protein